MPNYNGVWSLSTQYQYAADWAADNPTDFNRAIFAGGISSSTIVDVIQFVTIATTGNSTDFGNLTDSGRTTGSGCSSSTRGIFSGGKRSGNKDIIEHGVTGFLFELDNIKDASQYAAELFNDEMLSERVTFSARKIIESKFSIKSMRVQYHQLISEVTNN